MSPLLDRLAVLLGPAHRLRDPADLAPYAVDWRGAWRGRPLAALRPGSADQVAAALRLCVEAGLAVVPAGGRTGLCGGAVAREDGPPAVVLSLERLNRVRETDARDFSITVDAGCTVQQVQAAAAEAGRLFPLSFGAEGTAQIGGALSTNAGGIRTIRWGNTRDLVLGLEAALPDGRVLDDLHRVRKDNSGYALRHLFIGAEGTLGVITGAALRLAPPLRRCAPRRNPPWKPPPRPANAATPSPPTPPSPSPPFRASSPSAMPATATCTSPSSPRPAPRARPGCARPRASRRR